MSSQSVLIITAVPNFVSPEEHRNIVASTPPSFSDIPPVLRHKEENVSVSLEPPLAGFTLEDSDSGVLYIIERYARRYLVYTPPIKNNQCARLRIVHRPWIPGQVPRNHPSRNIARRRKPAIHILSTG